MLLGAHVSIAGGIFLAPERGKELGCDCIQIFSKNQMQWAAAALAEKDAEVFREAFLRSGLQSAVVHGSYLTNLASPDPKLLEKSRKAFLLEMERCAQLGIELLIFHPGAHMGAGEEKGLKTIAESLEWVLERGPEGITLTLENTAGQGSLLCSGFEQLAKIIELVGEKKRVAVCIDTCHTFAAGYDFVQDYSAVWREFERTVGLEKIRAFHLNDAKAQCGSHLDRHENIGKGKIGKDGFVQLMNDRRFEKIPMNLETPGGDMGYKKDLKFLRSLIK